MKEKKLFTKIFMKGLKGKHKQTCEIPLKLSTKLFGCRDVS